jgi:hypothetical protein
MPHLTLANHSGRDTSGPVPGNTSGPHLSISAEPSAVARGQMTDQVGAGPSVMFPLSADAGAN